MGEAGKVSSEREPSKECWTRELGARRFDGVQSVSAIQKTWYLETETGLSLFNFFFAKQLSLAPPVSNEAKKQSL